MNFQQVREQVAADDEGKWDAVVLRDALSFRDGKLIIPESHAEDYASVLTPTTWALSQLCGRLGIPSGYFKKCPPELQDAQANYWLQQALQPDAGGSSRAVATEVGRAVRGGNFHNSSVLNGSVLKGSGITAPLREETQGDNRNDDSRHGDNRCWLIRAKDESLRGVLSNSYAKLDNAHFLDSIEPHLHRRFQVQWLSVGEESLHLRIVDPRLARDVLPNDRVMAGIHIGNSEVGKRAVTVDAMVFRLICSNGMIGLVRGQSLLYQRHIHVSQSQFALLLGEAVGEAFQAASLLIERFEAATKQPVSDVEAALERLGDRWHLSQGLRETVKLTLLNEQAEQQETVYGLANAFTSVAQRLSADDRYQLEVLAGQLVEHGVPKSATNRKSARAVEPETVSPVPQSAEGDIPPLGVARATSPLSISTGLLQSHVRQTATNTNGSGRRLGR